MNFNTIPDDQTYLRPKKATTNNLKGRLVGAAVLSFVSSYVAVDTPPRWTPRKARSPDRRARGGPTARTTTASTWTRAASRKPLLPVVPSSARPNSLQAQAFTTPQPLLLLSLPTVY